MLFPELGENLFLLSFEILQQLVHELHPFRLKLCVDSDHFLPDCGYIRWALYESFNHWQRKRIDTTQILVE
jgi:hypothetical protein